MSNARRTDRLTVRELRTLLETAPDDAVLVGMMSTDDGSLTGDWHDITDVHTPDEYGSDGSESPRNIYRIILKGGTV